MSTLGDRDDSFEGDIEEGKIEGVECGDGGGDSDGARAGGVEVRMSLARTRAVAERLAKSRR